MRSDTIQLRPETICLACGEALTPALQRSASLRCQDCRDCAAPLRSDLVAPPAPDAVPAALPPAA